MSQLRFTDTNSADDSHGKTWGLDGNLFWYVIGGAFVSVVTLLLLFSVFRMGFLPALGAAVVPFALTVVYVFAFRQGKPPGYDVDCLDYLINGSGFGPESNHENTHPLKQYDV